MKAQSYVNVSGNLEVNREAVKDVPFTTVANLVTAMLMELKRTYVTAPNTIDRKMRKRINRTIEIVNAQPEIANLIIKGNPFRQSRHSSAPAEDQPEIVVEVENEDS